MGRREEGMGRTEKGVRGYGMYVWGRGKEGKGWEGKGSDGVIGKSRVGGNLHPINIPGQLCNKYFVTVPATSRGEGVGRRGDGEAGRHA